MVDKDRAEGSAKNLGGKLKKGMGRLAGDAKLKREGEADQIRGRAQNAIGGIKDEAREELERKNRR